MSSGEPWRIFVTVATGYAGCLLIPRLLARVHQLTTLARFETAGKILTDCATPSWARSTRLLLGIGSAAWITVIQLVGVAKPTPWKGPVWTIGHPPVTSRILDVSEIRRLRQGKS
jgi:hypothetical protein